MIVLLITALAYINIFFNGPVIDDKVFLGKYCPSVVEAFQGVVPKGHEGVYRPVRGVIYSVYCKIWGGNVWGYHLHSLLVHLAATGLVYLIVGVIARTNGTKQSSIYITPQPPLKLRGGDRTRSGVILDRHASSPRCEAGTLAMTTTMPFIAALLFGLHPVHTEAITYMAASMEMTGIVFMLASFWLYLKGRDGEGRIVMRPYILSILFATLAFFTYEMTLTLPLLILWYEFIYHPLPPLKLRGGDRIRSGAIWVILGIYVLVRMGSVGIAGRAPYLANSVYLTAITMPKVMVKYLTLMVWPVNLVNNQIIAPGIEAFVYRGYRTAAILRQSILDPEILLSLMVIIVIMALAVINRKKQPMISFGIGWFFISLLPVLEIVPQGSMLNERSLYLASVGFVMLIAWAINKLKVKSKKLKVMVVILIALFYGGGTMMRNGEWRDEVTFWGREVLIYPTESAYGRFSLGDAYYLEKKYPEAIEQYKKSVEINPGFAVGYASLARTYADINQVELSNLNYQLAEQAEPGFWARP